MSFYPDSAHKKNARMKDDEMYSASQRIVVVKVLCYKPEGRGFETR
jgi:hypothetical protein